jgi:hypothetical protein
MVGFLKRRLLFAHLSLVIGCGLDFDDLNVAGMPTVATPLTLANDPFTNDPMRDRDGDCLDDDAEHAIARWYTPLFVFDSRENARRTHEPAALYQVTSLGGCRSDVIELRYAYLFADDGGYAESTFCSNRHPGDNQYLRLTLTLREHTVTLRSAWAWGFTWPMSPFHFSDGHHMVVFLSAGKHHPYFDTRVDGAGSPYSSVGCIEAMDGRGAHFEAVIEHDGVARGRNNVGERRSHSASDFVDRLDGWGYTGERAWGEQPFCGGTSRRGCDNNVNAMQAVWR